jgi:hypothetical protein
MRKKPTLGVSDPKVALETLGIRPKAVKLDDNSLIDEKIAKYVLNTPGKVGRPMESYSEARLHRLMYDVAPMVCRGATIEAIAKATKVTIHQADVDKLTVEAIWAEMADQTGNLNLYREIACKRLEYLYSEAVDAWSDSRQNGRANPKLLEQANKILENLHKVQGVMIDMTMVQNNMNFGKDAMSAEELSQLFN